MNSPAEFEHFLITRFNLRNKSWEKTRGGDPVLTDTWLQNRFHLFKTICLPSVKHQTQTRFRWLVFFDTTTDAKAREQVAALSEGGRVFEPCYVDGWESYQGELKKILGQSRAGHLITTRLDNDDAISVDFIDTIQGFFDFQEFLPLDFVNGYSLGFGARGVKLGRRLHMNNPFMSLIEKKTDSLKTVTLHRHAGWKREKATRHIRTRPLWLTVVHDGNLANKYEGHSRVSPREILERFQLGETVAQEIANSHYPVERWWGESVLNKVKDHLDYYMLLLKIRLNFYK